jgi:hypothetical protein
MYKLSKKIAYNDENHQAKNNCRELIVEAVKNAGIVPQTIFTLPGELALDVVLFRKTWGDSQRIICIERTGSCHRTDAHEHGCEIYHMTLDAYVVNNKSQLISRIIYNKDASTTSVATKAKKVKFDYPRFDLVYLDLCSTPKDFIKIARFIDNETNCPSIIAVTMSAMNQDDADAKASNIIALTQCKPVAIKVFPYTTASDMMLAIFQRI